MQFVEIHADADQSVLFLHGGNVAGWIWREQASRLADHHALIPDLPGFGASADEQWTNLADLADNLANLIRAHAKGGRVHIVGLSLGGILGVVLAARHPEVVRSTFVTSAAVRGVGVLSRVSGFVQLRFWDRQGYWMKLAELYKLPEDSRDEFISTGLGANRLSVRRMMREVYQGVPRETLDGLRSLDTPLLAIAGELDAASVRNALPDISGRAPHSFARLAPRMHHVWSAEDPELFHRVLTHWLTHAEPSPELTKPQSDSQS